MNKTRRLEKLVKERCLAGNLQLEEAVSLFHRLLSPDSHHPPSILTINFLLKSIAKTKHPSRFPTVLTLFNRLRTTRDTGASLTIRTFGLVLDCCCLMGRADLGFCVLGQSLREGCGVDTIMFGSLIRELCTRKRMRDAAKVLAKMPLLGCAPNLIIYNTLMDGYCRKGNIRMGLELFRLMSKEGSCFKPNAVTFGTLIHGFCREGEIAVATEMFEEMVAKGVMPNVNCCSILIDGLCKNGDVVAARKVFEQMPSFGVVANLYTYNSLINGLCKNGDVIAAQKVFEEMSVHGIVADLYTYNSLIGGLCSHGDTNSAFRMFDKMAVEGLGPNVITYTILIHSLCSQGNMNCALKMFEEMIAKRLVPDVYTYNDLILGFCNVGDIDKAFVVYEEVVNSGLQANACIYTTLLKGEWNCAIRVFREMVNQGISPDVVTFNALMVSLCRHRQTCEAEKLVCLMEENGVKPDVITYTTVLQGYVQESHLDKATELINEALRMVDKMMHHGLKPNDVIFDILLNAVSNSLWSEKLQLKMKAMPALEELPVPAVDRTRDHFASSSLSWVSESWGPLGPRASPGSEGHHSGACISGLRRAPKVVIPRFVSSLRSGCLSAISEIIAGLHLVDPIF
ncbi:Pentatricopeptide repeat (PPR) superfamily protein [Rhynchospora pubera]|uniref:Pentatricopeptide repeat (PPR) superfamily protein n=1 Tax=Rhynchospora pubera TaxID=906938 RepID=A0AAV8H2I3_9POAL|nr:Pentatricopeptide repeat (PPR) superfamily protein [Rhynchospora pubera]